jgi:hypothetical protein
VTEEEKKGRDKLERQQWRIGGERRGVKGRHTE